jgi:hypothetical protein
MDFSTIVKLFVWILSSLVLPGPLVAADEDAKPSVCTVQTATGAPVDGVLRELKPDWSVRLGEGDGTSIPGRDVLALRRTGVPLPPLPADEHLILANGDRIPYRSLRLTGEMMQFRHARLDKGEGTTLPLAAVAIVWRIAPDRALDAERLRHRLVTETRTRDTVCLRNGDVLSGVLTAFDEQKVEMDVDKKRVTVRMPQVAYLALNTELADTLRPKGMYARLALLESKPGHGGRLSLTSAACADGITLTGTTVFGARLSVPMSDVAALDVYQGHAVYLSDLKPSKYEYHAYLDASWAYAVNGNVAEHDLHLGGSTFDRGISLHSHARLTYRLNGAYRRFDALVGLDDRDGRRGSVRIRVLADGRALDLGDSSELTAQSGPRAIAVPIEGARELTLEVQFGDNGDVQDVVDWVDARLVKE